MAVTLTPKTQNLSLRLSAGTSASGAVKTVSVSIANIDPTAEPSVIAENAMPLVYKITPCLEHSLYDVRTTRTQIIDEE